MWFLSTAGVPAAQVESARAVLSAEERARADRFRAANDRRDYSMAHYLMRRCLSKDGPLEPAAWRFERGPAGKPFLAGEPGREIGLSHTRDLVACAIADRDIGLDVENLDALPRQRASVERSFAPAEAAAFARSRGAGRDLVFLELWTLKEAFLKAVGVGLDRPLDSFAFDLSRKGSIAFRPPPGVEARDWQFALFEPLPRTRLAVAAKARAPARLVVRRFAPGSAVREPSPLGPLRTTRTVSAGAD